jgi:hypothetical protein
MNQIITTNPIGGTINASRPQISDIYAPAPLRDMPNWVGYRLVQYSNENKPRKIPYWADGTKRFGTQGGPEDRARLTTFEVAREAAIRMDFDGVGFAHTEGCGIVTLDFDKCVGPDGNVRQDVLDLVTMTYAEFSPSGKGIHAIFIGDADILGNHKANVTEGPDFSVEAFSSKGFTTFTGNTLDYVDIIDGPDHLAPLPDVTTVACKKRFRSSQSRQFDPDDFMIGHEPKTGLSPLQMKEMLAVLDPDMSREDWIKVAMGLHHETDGDDTGFYIFNDWSANGEKYPNEEELRKQWDSFDRRKGSGLPNITMRTVQKMATEVGYHDPRFDISPVQPADLPKVDATPSLPLLDPFPGFMADVTDLALATAHRRQPAMTLLGVLVAMASACGSKIYLPDGMRLNLFGLCAAPTGSGKDHVLHVSGEIARAAGALKLGEFASGAGLEDALCEGGIFASIDEIAHVLSARGDHGGQLVRDVETIHRMMFSAII